MMPGGNSGSDVEKMKSVLCVLAGLCVLAYASHHESQVADKNHLLKQKAVYELFWHVDQPTLYHSELYQKARSFNLLENVNHFSDKEAVNEFVDLLKHGMLPRGQAFTSMDPEMLHQAVVLFRVLHSAQDFDTFYNVAVWARFNLNELMYIYSLSLAVIHRPDTRFIKLPPLQEILPHFFFNEDVMQKAYNIAMGDVGSGMKKTVGGVDNFIIPANYSGWFPARENVPEQKLSYFTEDVGLNAFYFLMNQNYPIFVPSKGENLESLTRGEYYFFIHKQLLARYYLERLANDMGEIELLSVWKPITNGFYPSMHFRNGLPFPQRENNAVVPLRMQKHIWILQDLRSRISNAIDIGFAMDTKGNHVDIYGENGLNIIGNIVQGNADSINKRFYGQLDTLARKIFGFGLDSNVKYQIVPSALQILSTSMRDPVFYSLYKGILSFYMRYKEHTPKYSKEELLCPGVKVESVTVDKLLTYFDDFDSMLNNGVSIRSQKEARASLIKARQQRLNHKPFTYHIDVNSEKNMKAIIRVFLGPKYDVHGHELDLPNNYMNFMEMDEWVVDLKMGSNKIERSSHESIFVMPDEVPSDVFYKKLLASIEGSDSFSYSMQPYGFPDRLILPKGKKEGMPYKLFVVVSPFDEAKAAHMDSPIWGRMLHDGRPMGFPFDRPVDPLHFMTPNMFLKDVVIFHKEVEQLNVPAESP